MPARSCPRPPRLAWLAGELVVTGRQSIFHWGGIVGPAHMEFVKIITLKPYISYLSICIPFYVSITFKMNSPILAWEYPDRCFKKFICAKRGGDCVKNEYLIPIFSPSFFRIHVPILI